MNKKRRQWLETIINKLEEQRDELESLQQEEQEAFDNLPASIACTERGEEMEENADDLETAKDDLDNVICNLQDIVDK